MSYHKEIRTMDHEIKIELMDGFFTIQHGCCNFMLRPRDFRGFQFDGADLNIFFGNETVCLRFATVEQMESEAGRFHEFIKQNTEV